MVTTWFPSATAPASGVFVARDAKAISAHPEVDSFRVVHLVAPAHDDGSRETELNGVRVVRLPMAPARPGDVIRAAARLDRLLRDVDVVHSAAISALLPLALRRPRVPWVHTEHWSGFVDGGDVSAALRSAMPTLRATLRRPDVVTAVSHYLARHVGAARRDKPTVVVPNIVDVEGAPLARMTRSAGRVRLAAVGGLTPRKGPLLAIETVAELRRRGLDASLTWVGDGPLRGVVDDRTARLGVAEHVKLLGTAGASGVASALAACDVFLLPTSGETFCVAAAEALAVGRPVVMGAKGGQTEFVSEAVGVLVPVQEPAAYANAVETVLDRTDGMRASAIAATLGGRFSAPRVADGYLAAYHLARGDM